MDIDQNVNQIVQTIIDQITTKVQTEALAVISQKVTEIVSAIDCTPMIAGLLSNKIDQRIELLNLNTNTIHTELVSRVNATSQDIITNVQNEALIKINEVVSEYIRKTNFQNLIQGTILEAIGKGEFDFPPDSLSASSIKVADLQISGDNISGGIIQKFGSTGIDDRSTTCQLTIMDELTVVENNLLTKDLTVKGTTTIEGDLNVTGTIPESSPMFINFVSAATNNIRTSLDQVIFKSYADMVLDTIRNDGLDLNKITLNGDSIVDNTTLGGKIINSSLQKVGQLRELQVAGEAFLSDTLYTTQRRVGINTLEPTRALSIWDQEIELGISKQSSGVAVIETPRNQTLVLSSNGKNNLSLLPDGSVAVEAIKVGNTMLTSSDTPPATNQPKGTVVFNSNPTLGGPLGWISLGEARWANFGLID